MIFYDRGIIVLDASKVFEFETFDEDNPASITTNPSPGTVCKITNLGTTTADQWNSKGASSNPIVGEVFVANDEDSSGAGFGDGEFVEGTNLIAGLIDSVEHQNSRPFKHNLKLSRKINLIFHF